MTIPPFSAVLRVIASVGIPSGDAVHGSGSRRRCCASIAGLVAWRAARIYNSTHLLIAPARNTTPCFKFLVARCVPARVNISQNGGINA